MRVLLLCLVCAIGCADTTAPAVPGGGSGGPITGGGGGTDGGVDGGLDGGLDGGEPRGACDNDTDLDALENAGDNGRNIARVCGLPSNMTSFCAPLVLNGPRYEECISECVQAQIPGLSTECASCYGALERCGSEQIPSCWVSCQQNLCSTLCLDCLNGGGCIDAYEACRGLPGDGCPD